MPRAEHGEKTRNAAHGADDSELFLNAVGQVSSLRARGREVAAKPMTPAVVPSGVPAAVEPRKFVEGGLEFVLSLTDEHLEGHVVGLDMAVVGKLRAGALSPEAHIDLHGLNAAQAFETLRGFMRGCWYRGMRMVLVVPGRGRNSPNGMGVLREKLPHWLTQEPFKRVVLAFCTAQSHDGGLGGMYVLLRKYRKKCRVRWEKIPADADLY
ncbi:MAG: Smr/MutS family protein [Desulfovibrio sp.]|jgi:DNA-nicking Smr family endonuclease|nr:Smr/MutS family protein [Desulfovibrio sp.]